MTMTQQRPAETQPRLSASGKPIPPPPNMRASAQRRPFTPEAPKRIDKPTRASDRPSVVTTRAPERSGAEKPSDKAPTPRSDKNLKNRGRGRGSGWKQGDPVGTGLSKGQRRRLNAVRRSQGLPPIGETL